MGDDDDRAESERDLMRRVAAGDDGAFAAIYDRYSSQAFGLALRLMRQRAAAEDVTQDAFLNLWRNAGRYQAGRGSLQSWLLRIVRNSGIDALRRGARHQREAILRAEEAAALEEPEHTEEIALRREDARQIRGLMAELPVKQRQVLELAYFRERTHAEVAGELNVPIGTVKGRIRLAQTRLHRALA